MRPAIQFVGRQPDKRVIGVGITKPTYEAMLRGHVMEVDCEQLGVPGVKLLIVAGPDHYTITRDLQSYIGQETGIHVDPSAVIQGGK